MHYENIRAGRFISRPNRFIAWVEVDGREEKAHVKNTGRCRELLIPGAQVYLQEHSGSARKTRFSLIAVRKGGLLVNMDSQAPNKAVQEWLLQKQFFGRPVLLKPECRFGDSRFDFYLETADRKIFIEVKGVTLEENGAARFPDAPTERGIKHLHGLMQCLKAGYEAAVIFVVQMQGMKYFEPNRKTHPEFAGALRKAAAAGVQVLAWECRAEPDSLCLHRPLPVQL